MRGTTGLAWEVEDRVFIVWYLCTNMGGLGMGCDRWVTVTIGFGLVYFITLQEKKSTSRQRSGKRQSEKDSHSKNQGGKKPN